MILHYLQMMVLQLIYNHINQHRDIESKKELQMQQHAADKQRTEHR